MAATERQKLWNIPLFAQTFETMYQEDKDEFPWFPDLGDFFKENPKDFSDYCDNAIFLFRNDRHDEAYAAFERAIELDLNETVCVYELIAFNCLDDGKLSEADAFVKSAMTIVQELRKSDEVSVEHALEILNETRLKVEATMEAERRKFDDLHPSA
ncbi:MAG: tetratricopeptide repeat protein [Pseudomonadota bacterium]